MVDLVIFLIAFFIENLGFFGVALSATDDLDVVILTTFLLPANDASLILLLPYTEPATTPGQSFCFVQRQLTTIALTSKAKTDRMIELRICNGFRSESEVALVLIGRRLSASLSSSASGAAICD